MDQDATSSVFERLGALVDAMAVRRVFGEPYEVGDVTVVPVARVRGGIGGGGGSGVGPDGEGQGSGAGIGGGLDVRPVGVFAISDGRVTWQPAIDVMRIVVGGQLLALAAILVLGRRRRRRR